eukprot:c28451_g1_i1 orf=19-249(+)
MSSYTFPWLAIPSPQLESCRKNLQLSVVLYENCGGVVLWEVEKKLWCYLLQTIPKVVLACGVLHNIYILCIGSTHW